MKAALAVLLLLAPAAAYAQAADPYDQAVAARLAGRNAEAVRILEPLSRERPNDADVWLNLGLAYMAVGRADDADRALATALRLAPEYQDVKDARARLAKMRAAPSEPSWRLDAGASYSRLSAGLEPWRGAWLYLGRRAGPNSWTLGAEHTDRFGKSDLYLEGRAGHDFGGWDGYLAAGGTADADHRPEVALKAGAQLAGGEIGGGWRARPGLDASWARYASGDVKSLQPGVTLEHELMSLTGRWIATWDEFDEFRSGYSVNGALSIADRWRLYAGFADAPESSEGVTIDVQAVSLGLGVNLDDRTDVRLDGTREDRGAYDRDEVALGLTRRF